MSSSREAFVTTAVLTGAAAFASLSRTAIEDHRLWTHRSIAFENDNLEKAYRVAGSHLTDTKRWAAVHRIHHSTPDANLVPFVELADYIDWRNDPTIDHETQPEIPGVVHGMDPVLKKLEVETAYEIGSIARELVVGKYQPLANYTLRAAGLLLYDTKPRYFYEDAQEMKHDRENPVTFDPEKPPTLHQIRFLLRDPHSPALHRRGIPGILRSNVPNYGYVEHNFEDPSFRPEDLQPDEIDTWTRENRGKLRYAYVGGMVLTSIVLGRSLSREKLARQAFLGAAASGLAVVGLIAGGNITNSFGHAGDIRRLTIKEFFNGVVHPYPDGTYTNDDDSLGPATLDEVGGQRVHHDHPELIPYSLDTGIRKIKKAPFGSLLEFMANRNIILKTGDNFAGQQRPDLPSEAVLRLQEERAKFLANQTEETFII